MTDPRSLSSDDPADWWATAIANIAPGVIQLRGHAIEQLITSWDFPSVVWLMVRGTAPSPIQARLLEAAIVASVDHGPQAPSIAAARMAATCGVGINSAVATGVNMLGDTHGGAGQQCLAMLAEIIDVQTADSASVADTAASVVNVWRQRVGYVPGFGHRFHPTDPRRRPLLDLVRNAVNTGAVSGAFLAAGLAVEQQLGKDRVRPVPMNIDGATAIVYGELGFSPEAARGLFVLARSVGILANALEERQAGARIKGPMPTTILPRYVGPSLESDLSASDPS